MSNELGQLISRMDVLENKLDKIIKLLENKETTTKSKTRKVTVKKAQAEPIKKGTCSIDLFNDVLLIGGNTFDRRELIKSFGGRWNPQHKGWTVKADKCEYVREQLEMYFETVKFNKNGAKKNLIESSKNEFSDENHSFGSNDTCEIDSDSD